MKNITQKALAILFVTFFSHTAFGQATESKEELILQTFHSGFKVTDIQIDPAATRMVTIGDDNQMLFYDLSKRLIYKRIQLPEQRKFHHIGIDAAGEQVISFESESKNGSLVYRSLQDARVIKTIPLQTILDSLALYEVSSYFMEISQKHNSLTLLATSRSKTYFTNDNTYLLQFELHSGKFVKHVTLNTATQVNGFLQHGQSYLVLLPGEGIIEYNTTTNQTRKVWTQTDKTDTPASMRMAGNTLWLLTDKHFYQFNTTNWQLGKIHPLRLGTNSMLTRNHQFETDPEGNAYHYTGGSESLQIFNLDNVSVFGATPSVYIPDAMHLAPAKKLLAVADRDKITLLDYEKKSRVFYIENSLSTFENLYFYEPGVAYAAQRFKDGYFKIDLTRGLISRQTFADEGFYDHRQLLELPVSKMKVAYNGRALNFYDAKSLQYKYTLSIEDRQFHTQHSSQLETGTPATGDNRIFVSEDEKLLVTVKPGHCALLVWDLENRKFLREIKLDPKQANNTQYIYHVDFHAKEKLVYAETSTNFMGNTEAVVADVQTGKILHQTSINHAYDFSGTFFPTQKKVVFPGETIGEVYALDLATNAKTKIQLKGDHPQISADEKIIYTIQNESINRYDLETGETSVLGNQPGLDALQLDHKSGMLLSFDNTNTVRVWDTTKEKLLFTLLSKVPEAKEVEPSYLLITPENYYMGGGDYANFMLLNKDSHIIPFEQLDRVYNRPDKVLASIGRANPTLLTTLTKTADRRAGQQNLDKQLPKFKALIKNKQKLPFSTTAASIDLSLAAEGTAGTISAYQVWLNGVALHPSKGKTITASSPNGLTEKITLTEKTNRIEVAFWDNKGNESYHDLAVVDKMQPPTPSLWLVGIGASTYQNTQYDLKFAAKDIQDITDYLKTARTFKKVNTLTLKNEQVTKAALAQLDQFLAKAAPEDMIMVYYAGHGLLDDKQQYFLASHNMDFDNPSLNGIAVEQLEKSMLASKAVKKVLIIDACHSGLMEEAIDASAGHVPNQDNVSQTGRGVSVPRSQSNFVDAEVLQSAFLNINKGDGLTIIAASSGSELAYEDPQFQNGLFTYSFLEGLKLGKADLNKDKEISLSEIKSYVEKRVVDLSKGKQRPTNRRKNNYFDFTVWNAEDRVVKQLTDAVSRNDTTTINQLLSEGYTVDMLNEETGYRPIHYAARDNALNSMRLLLNKKAQLDAKTEFGYTPLYLAVHNNNIESAYLLIVHGAKVKDELFYYNGVEGKISLEQIAKINKSDYLADLLRRSDVLRENDKVYRNMLNAMFTQDVAKLNSIYTSKKVDLNFVLPDARMNLMHFAVYSKNPEFVNYLHQKGAVVSNIPNTTFAPLHLAAYLGDEQMIKSLLEAGALKTEKDADAKLPKDYLQSDNPVLKALLE